MSTPILRWYQSESLDAVVTAWNRGVKRPALVLCTGSGKTVILAQLVSLRVRGHRSRVLILVHREELVDQTVAKLHHADPHLSVGVIKAERHELNADVVVASVASISRRLGVGRRAISPDRFDLVIVDEAHHASARTYMATLEFFGVMDKASDTVGLGVTATLARADNVPLGHVWEEVVFVYDTTQAIEDGYLVRPIAQRVVLDDLRLDLAKISHGDYTAGDLGEKMIRSGAKIGEAILAHAVRDGRVRRGIVFAPDVDCCRLWAADFNAMGIRSRVVTGDTPREERRATYDATHRHANDMIVSCMVLTEGFDLPSVEVAVIARPTRSLPLYTQMVGRVLRPSPKTGKTDALVLDVMGVMQQKLITLIDLGLPKDCACRCDCDTENLCAKACRCPRTRRGVLKMVCPVCEKAERFRVAVATGEHVALRAIRIVMPCAHYEDEHVWGCPHRCPGRGRPGLYPDDEEPDIIEDPAEAKVVMIDDSEIVTAEVDLFDWSPAGQRNLRAAPRPKRKTGWMTTHKGRPFLPSTSTFEETIFLHQDEDGTWSVGEAPRRGKPTRLESGLTFADAVKAAEAAHPLGGRPARPLAGYASQSQLDVLERNGRPAGLGELTKQEANEMISVIMASRILD